MLGDTYPISFKSSMPLRSDIQRAIIGAKDLIAVYTTKVGAANLTDQLSRLAAKILNVL